MTETELAVVHACINEDGFDYTLLYLDDFTDINDPTFHELRKKYIEASQAMYVYLKMDASEFSTPEVATAPKTILKSW